MKISEIFLNPSANYIRSICIQIQLVTFLNSQDGGWLMFLSFFVPQKPPSLLSKINNRDITVTSKVLIVQPNRKYIAISFKDFIIEFKMEPLLVTIPLNSIHVERVYRFERLINVYTTRHSRINM